MNKFRELLTTKAFNQVIDSPSVSVKFKKHELSLRFDSLDTVVKAGYTGEVGPWFSSLCFLLEGKTLTQAYELSWKDWEEAFQDEQLFWDLKREIAEDFFQDAFELLKASLDVYQGREYLYQEASPLICRCFGVRENDVLEFLRKNSQPTLDALSTETKAGMGCRSCVPQLKRWLVLHEAKKFNHHYKERPVVDWLIQIDYQLGRFPHAVDWKMEVQGMKAGQVSVSFEKDVSQKEEEEMGKELQRFLAAGVDLGLAFFLRRARHFSKARG
jgi:bacterioferritin-associated ferredoxin